MFNQLKHSEKWEVLQQELNQSQPRSASATFPLISDLWINFQEVWFDF